MPSILESLSEIKGKIRGHKAIVSGDFEQFEPQIEYFCPECNLGSWVRHKYSK